jgi:hypothetical protein
MCSTANTQPAFSVSGSRGCCVLRRIGDCEVSSTGKEEKDNAANDEGAERGRTDSLQLRS